MRDGNTGPSIESLSEGDQKLIEFRTVSRIDNQHDFIVWRDESICVEIRQPPGDLFDESLERFRGDVDTYRRSKMRPEARQESVEVLGSNGKSFAENLLAARFAHPPIHSGSRFRWVHCAEHRSLNALGSIAPRVEAEPHTQENVLF